MRVLTRHAAVALIVLSSVLLGGCGGAGGAASTASTIGTTDDLTGLIVEIRGTGPDVRSFTLRAEGESYEILIAPDVDYGFELSHLREHASSTWPIRCSVERRRGALYALAIYDA